jgi:CBS domain-containing protein
MSLGTLLARKAITAQPHEPLCVAARLMEQKKVGAIVVVERDRPV